jgi:hypothetical protein
MNPEIESMLTPALKMSRDALKALRQQGGGITDNEARFLTDLYYTNQKTRIRLNNQVKGLDRDAKKSGRTSEPHDGLTWVYGQSELMEANVEKILRIYVEGHAMSWFFEQTLGVGPGILAAGLLSHIDIHKAPTAGHIYRFAGLDPTVAWDKGTKRPWNATLKTLCWKIGDSFVKVSNKPSSLYGRIYRERKAYEWQRNLTGANTEACERALAARRIGKDTDAHAWYSGNCDPAKAREALEEGTPPTAKDCAAEANGVPMLPPAQIDARARRYAVKLFLSHLQECWWRQETGTEPPAPYAISHLSHAHYIPPPQTPPGM